MAQVLLTILINACWQIALVTLFAICCNRLLRGTAAWCRHAVWVAALIISFGLPIVSGLNNIELPANQPREVARNASEIPAPRTVELTQLESTAPTTLTFEPPTEPSRQSDWTAPVPVNRNLIAVLVGIYAFFVLYRSVKLFRAWRRTRSIVRSIYPAPIPASAVAVIRRCQTALGVQRAKVVCSKDVQLPITAGVVRPLIILPEQLLTEADGDILLSAIGHELVHVARRDYILNLVYELIYLPLSFHPGAALLRRRIKQTRELCCDELVAAKLLAPELYARSLVRLVGSVPLAGRLAPDTTIGITDADILEVRIMSLLKTSKPSARRNTLLLIAASLLLAAPCVAAAAYAPEFEIDNRETETIPPQEPKREVTQDLQRARQELEVAERELVEQARKISNPQELEKLRRSQEELREASQKLSHEQDSQHMREAEKSLTELQQGLLELAKTHPVDEARMREMKAQMEQLERSLPDARERLRQGREQLARVVEQYPNAEVMAEYMESVRRAQSAIEQQKEALSKDQREKLEEKLKNAERAFEGQDREREVREKIEMKERAAEEKLRDKDKDKVRTKLVEKEMRKNIDKQIRREIEAKGGRSRDQIELSQSATMSMDRAIQIATSQHPGKVLSCTLGRQKDGQPFYRLVIIDGAGDKSSVTHVWVSATDGRILKTEHE
jgi:beta-lactamase regulating signal transducer with metallopeptidase domain/uncharacterized membrane protein YkoI